MAGFAALELNQSDPQHTNLQRTNLQRSHSRSRHTLYPFVDHQFAESVTVFCDFDGPIVDVSDRYYSTYKLGLVEVQSIYQKQAIALPLNVLSKNQFWQMKQERTPDREIALRSGLCGKQIEQFLQCVQQIVNRVDLLHQDRLQPGVKQALSQLHGQGMSLILVTLRRQSQAVQLLRHFGVAHLFTQIYGANDDEAAYLNQAEHKAQLLSNAISEAGLQPESSYRCNQPYPACPSAWMIGDTEADILAGQAMNISTIALTCGIRSQAYLQRFRPTHFHTDLAAAAAYLLQSGRVAAA